VISSFIWLFASYRIVERLQVAVGDLQAGIGRFQIPAALPQDLLVLLQFAEQ
jgi:hypothetical protein